MTTTREDLLEAEVRMLCSRIEAYMTEEQHVEAANEAARIVRLLSGRTNLRSYDVAVAVASADRPWFRETVKVDASTRVLAIAKAQSDVIRKHELPPDASVRCTLL